MSFITPASVAPTDSKLIKNSPFFPDLSLADARDAVRLDGTVTEPRLRNALVTATLSVNQALSQWREKQLAAGYLSLAAVPGETVDGITEHLLNYQTAVYCTAAAQLNERLKNFDSTAKGRMAADLQSDPIDDHRRDAHWAINAILGIPRTSIELI